MTARFSLLIRSTFALMNLLHLIKLTFKNQL